MNTMNITVGPVQVAVPIAGAAAAAIAQAAADVAVPAAATAVAASLRASNTIPFGTRADLLAAPGAAVGHRSAVSASDVGTHTDPVTLAVLPNAGAYSNVTPHGWVRVDDLDSQVSGADADAAAASASTSAGNASAAVAAAGSAAADRATTAANLATTTSHIALTAADVVQTGIDRAAAQGYALTAQAIGLAAFIDAAVNIVIGTGAAGSTGGTDGGVSLGTGAGVGLSQTYSAKHIGIGFKALIGGARGYAMDTSGAYVGARSVGNWLVAHGTHAAQDANAIGVISPGFGARATGTITFSGTAAGQTIEPNGVPLVVGTDFPTGATPAETAENLVTYLAGSTNPLLLRGLYTRPNTTSAVVNVASLSRGTAGNAFTLAKTGADIAVSGAVLSGGTDVSGLGLPANSAGDVAAGFSALGYVQRTPTTRKAMIEATIVSNPVDGDIIKFGFNFTATVTFKTTPVGALDVQIGATKEETFEALAATLNGSANTTIDDVTYWVRGGKFSIEHDTANVTTFACKSYTAALVFPAQFLQGAAANDGANVGTGSNALMMSFVSGSTATGDNALAFSSTGPHTVTGRNSGRYNNQRNHTIMGSNTGADIGGDNVLLFANDVNPGVQEAWLKIINFTTDGTVTFESPHGWAENDIQRCSWRDRAVSGAQLQVAPTGTGSWANISTFLGGLTLQAISADKAIVLSTLPNADTGARVNDYRSTGTVTNIDIARNRKDLPDAAGFGNGVAMQAGKMMFGSNQYWDGAQFDTPGVYFAVGDVRFPSIIPGTWANGYINFPNDLADGNTIVITDGTGTLTATAKTAISGTVTSGQELQFLIGATRIESARNFVAMLLSNDDQSAARKLANRVKFRVQAISGVGVRLHWTLLDTNVPALTFSSTASGAAVTVSSAGTFGNLPIETSTVPPKVGGRVEVTSSPLRNGGRGEAIYLGANLWSLR